MGSIPATGLEESVPPAEIESMPTTEPESTPTGETKLEEEKPIVTQEEVKVHLSNTGAPTKVGKKKSKFDAIPEIPVNTVTKDEIEQVIKWVREADEYKLEQTITRNVIIVGRTRSGKSTFVEVMKDVAFQPPQMSIFSQTRDPAFRSFSIGIDQNDGSIPRKFTINVVDTPGLFEVKEIGDEAQTNEAILNTIKECLKNEITKVHCVFIFLSVNSGISTEDVSAIEIFMDSFAHSQLTSVVCISRAEDFTPAQKAHYTAELQKFPKIAAMIEKHKAIILFSGCIDRASREWATKDQLLLAYKKLYGMREEILETIFACKDPAAPLVNLPIAEQQRERFLNLASESLNFLQSCVETKQDFSLSTMLVLLEKHKAKMDELSKAGDYLIKDPVLATKAKAIELTLTQLKAAYPQDIFRQLANPFKFE